jgi:hypothetical protein
MSILWRNRPKWGPARLIQDHSECSRQAKTWYYTTGSSNIT